MRPILVLLLVIAAVTAFLLTMNFGDKPKDPSTVTRETPQVSAPPTPVEEEDEPVVATDERERIEADQSTSAPSTAAAGDATKASNAVFGTVENEASQPVANAEVVLTRAGRTNLFPPDPVGERERDVHTTTNEKGEYRFTDVEPWSGYALVFRHPDYKLHEEGSVNVRATGDHPQPTVRLTTGLMVEGWIRDTLGQPIVGARIALGMFVLGAKDEKDPNTLRVESDDGGHYEFRHVERGTYALTVAAEGFGTVAIPNLRVVDVPVQQDVVLDTAEMIGGRVLGLDGEPVPSAVISAFALNQSAGRQSRSQVESDERGEFLIEDVSRGSYSLQVMATGFEPRREPRVDTGTMDLVLEVAPLPTISGRVIDAASGAPLSDFTVLLRQVVPNAQPPVSIPDPSTKVKVKGSSGEYVLACPRPGPYEVQATAPGYAGCYSQSITVSKGQNVVDINVFMTHGGGIRGRVVDPQGNPVARATVTTQDHEWTDDLFTQALGDQMPAKATVRTVRTKEDGTFEVQNLTPSAYLLDVQHAQFSRTFHKGVQVAEGQTASAGDITLIRGGIVTGIVYSPDGQPLAGAIVQLVAEAEPDGTPRNYSEKTASDGRYTFQSVFPGMYRISAQRSSDPTGDPFAIAIDHKDTRDKVSVVDGQSVTRDFHLGMSSGGK